ncbi:molybdopterin converting factor small subunit [Kribbella aluminosa]|uniref:Molybdopterin converting factor small subunit n=1 Tax=Kribbella aluminosa TaxID=416017 RepID=A0ABS4UHK0_9ACTN|nr:MoaD/ThiS family protein [Kribbella aluminosa]MBP2351125.1 molybdopterin converting factor small subunit [Kribbella aluminosa]
MIAVRLPTVLRPFAGGAERVQVEATTVAEAFAALDAPLRRRLTDEQGAVRRHVNVYLRDDNIRDLAGVETPLTEGDELLVLPSVAGG